MDPLTAIGFVGNILQFIEFSTGIILKAAEIYHGIEVAYHDTQPGQAPGPEGLNETGTTIPTGRRRMEDELRNFIFVTRTIVPNKRSKRKTGAATTYQIDAEALDDNIRYLIGHSQVLLYASRQPGQAGQSLQSVATACDNVASQMLQRLEHMRQTAKGKVWPSLKLAFRELWKASELVDMEKTLETHQRNLTILMVGSLRESFDLLAHRQEDQWNSSKNSVRDTVEEVIRNYMISGSQQSGSSMNLAGIAPETLKYMDERQKEATKEIVGAVNHALDARQLRPPDGPVLSWPPSDVIHNAAETFAMELLSQEQSIMYSLRFMTMESREEDISEVTAAFDWIFEDPKPEDLPWDNFIEWLLSDEPLYWITGKAGSGKSTLMKYLCRHSRVHEALSRWAGPIPLVVACYFFWRTGTQEQTTQEGLLRSLLYQILHKHRELIPILFSDNDFPGTGNSDQVWTKARLKGIFEGLVQQNKVHLKIVFIIDGLDEYAGNHNDIADLVRELSETDNIKVCASSRPLLDFELSFRKAPSLMLQNLTFNDIKTYVTNKFNEDTHVAQIQSREPGLTKRFASEIVNRASGVFLWVKCAVQSILKGLRYEDSSVELDRRLSELPGDLMELYSHMLKAVEPFYQGQGARFLQIVYEARKPFSILELAFCEVVINAPDTAHPAEMPRRNMTELHAMCTRMEHRLKVTCLGLLEVAPISSSSIDDARTITRPVRFMHQSVAEFLQEDVANKHMSDLLANQRFDPMLCLMKASILTLKSFDVDWAPISFFHPLEFWHDSVLFVITGFVTYAATKEAKHRKAEAQLVDQIDREAESLFKRNPPPKLPEESADLHWSEWRWTMSPFRRLQEDASMISFALEYGLYLYVQTSLGSGNGFQRRRKLTSRQARYALDVEEVAPIGHQVPAELRQSVRGELHKACRFRIQRFSRILGSHREGSHHNLVQVIRERQEYGKSSALSAGASMSPNGGQMPSLPAAFPEVNGSHDDAVIADG